jgi:hypothetical protein
MCRLARVVFAAALVTVSCAARQKVHPHAGAAAKPGPGGALEVRDLMPEFWRWWSGVEGQGPERQAASFLATMANAHPEIYTGAVLGSFEDQTTARASVRRYFDKMPEFLEDMRATSQRMPVLLQDGYAQFRRHFPDLSWNGPVYVIPALLNFDGATRPLSGRNHLFFAPDGIARWHKADGLCAFFAHEFFHIYHDQFFPEAAGPQRDPLWRSLWSEGLATYVSGELCPGTKEDAILMSATLAVDTRAVLPQVVRELRAQQNSMDQKVYQRFFLGQTTTDIPPRSAYYVGYLVARRAARSYTLEQLPRLDVSAALGVVESGLDELLRTGAP